jgi:hypothetical protein
VADVLRARHGEIQFAGIGFRIGDELRQRPDRQLALDGDHLRAGAHIRDRHQLLPRIEAELLQLRRQRDHRGRGK